ncbi:hypothetical protein [Diaphorobacter aerolatus]|uniref:Uncharacterized protein n=1 Tax=Diaphorobacter aerolatus TaxID=1288495 RepID=A0A7H0GL76_9BURK|nr:hypothetical protein [Diaphorobacter aerolatus]QNP49042.1 hypothetical protein H9K75_02460 [Diaphorobacter aerolatus]
MISSSVRNLFTRLAKPLGIRSDEADRERMSRLNGHGFFSAVDALLLTDCSPVADALSRCCLDDREGSDATPSIKPYQRRFNEDTHIMSIHTQQAIRKQLLQVTALAWGLRAPVRQYAPATRARSTLAHPSRSIRISGGGRRNLASSCQQSPHARWVGALRIELIFCDFAFV